MNVRLTAQGRRVTVTEHAIIRYRDRVKPALTVREARVDLLRMLVGCATVSAVCPSWKKGKQSRLRDKTDEWWMLGDDIALAGTYVHGVVVLHTTITRGGISDQAQADRAQRRKVVGKGRPARTKHGEARHERNELRERDARRDAA